MKEKKTTTRRLKPAIHYNSRKNKWKTMFSGKSFKKLLQKMTFSVNNSLFKAFRNSFLYSRWKKKEEKRQVPILYNRCACPVKQPVSIWFHCASTSSRRTFYCIHDAALYETFLAASQVGLFFLVSKRMKHFRSVKSYA